MKKLRSLFAISLTASLILTAAPTAFGAAATGGNGTNNGNKTVDLVDAAATESTRSLFAYLQEVRGKHVLFGHQHATDEVLSSQPQGEPRSETYAAVGDYPAMFGWDTLSLEGYEKPGNLSYTREQNRDNLVASMKAAYKAGGVLALSSHMPNFVTGGDFYDTSGNVVSHILPGGDKHEEYNEFLDMVADFALHLKDDKGKPIPVIFRPFHEQSGGWFWWGAPYTTKEQYIEIYRYTVEYLRDGKGVHNFLYAFSPGSPFNGLEETYLKTYPGDDYVDILGFDTYYDGANQGWFDAVIADAKLVSRIADARGKVAAFTEFGYSGVKPTGTADKQFFTKLIAALQSDPDAKRMAYMLTWANFNYDSVFVPYRNSLQYGDHELLPDFENYYKDPYTYFSRDLKGVYNKKVKTAKERPFMHIVSPTGQETIRTAATTVRARVLNEKVRKVVYLVGDSTIEHKMTLNEAGFYAADWQPAPELNGKGTTLTVKVYGKGNSVMEQTITVYVGIAEQAVERFTFDRNIDGVQSNGNWPEELAASFSYAVWNGDGKLKIDVSGLQAADSWQELKIGFPNLAQRVNLQQVNRVSFEAWIPVAAGSGNGNASLRAAAELPPSSSKFLTAAVTPLSELETVTVDGIPYAAYKASIDLNDPEQISAAEGLQLALIGSYLHDAGPIYFDNISLINAYTGESDDPTLVDDFEGYKESNDLLQAGYSPSGDNNTISLDDEHKASGAYGLKFDYSLAGQGYTGITKDLGSRDWTQTGRVKFWLQPDGSGKKMVVQVKANDIYFEYYPDLTDTTARWVEVPFKDFAVAPWDTANQDKKLDTDNAKKVQAFSIYVNAVEGDSYSGENPFNSTLYVDSISAVPGEPGDIPEGEGSGEGPGGGIPAGTLYGFENGTEGFIVEQNYANAEVPTVTTAVYAEGAQALATAFDLTEGSNFEVTKYIDLDLSGHQNLSVKVKLASGSANVLLYVKTGNSWQWYDGGTVLVDSSAAEFTTLEIDLSQIEEAGLVKSIGLKVIQTGGSGQSAFYVDDFSLS
ncbi:glycosyl hydrolase [Paenibacillus sp. M1]|uniref:Glycosyl hydrolase n=1 Tax=Paenibacillus haidiansis TaxID=1574488 RepID=A0ABU7VXE5_9BACL